MASQVYAFGTATPTPDKSSIYDLVNQYASTGQYTPDQIAKEFSNNPFGISYQELQSEATNGTPKATSTGSGVSSYASSLQKSIPGSISNVESTAGQAAGNQVGSLYNGANGILDYLSGLTSGQQKINTDSTNAELGKINATAGVNQTVGRGLDTAGKILASRNAGDSSASGEFARQYGNFGRQQLAGVNNQKAQADNQIAQEQLDFNTQADAGLRHLQDTKQQIANQIVQDATTRLNSLQDALTGASLADKIDIAAEQNKIRQSALSQLSQYDSMLSSGRSAVVPQAQSAAVAAAQKLATTGAPSPDTYNFQAGTAPALQGTGPTAGSLPIFTFPTKKNGS